jgi:hypothetical protein
VVHPFGVVEAEVGHLMLLLMSVKHMVLVEVVVLMDNPHLLVELDLY